MEREVIIKIINGDYSNPIKLRTKEGFTYRGNITTISEDTMTLNDIYIGEIALSLDGIAMLERWG